MMLKYCNKASKAVKLFVTGSIPPDSTYYSR